MTTLTSVVCLLPSVEDMIKEVDVDGDGRIDFYGKNQPCSSKFSIVHKPKHNIYSNIYKQLGNSIHVWSYSPGLPQKELTFFYFLNPSPPSSYSYDL